MLYVILNALIYLVFLGYIWKVKKRLDCGIVIIAHWTLIAVMSILCYSASKEWLDHVILWPYLYLFVAFILYARYYVYEKDLSKKLSDIVKIRSKVLDYLCYLYVICVIISVPLKWDEFKY